MLNDVQMTKTTDARGKLDIKGKNENIDQDNNPQV